MERDLFLRYRHPVEWIDRDPIGLAVGERLRSVRHAQRLSLPAVEQLSESEFKASVLGAYERGERVISAARLLRLAEIYAVPTARLLPRHAALEINLADSTFLDAGFTIDLGELDGLAEPEAGLLSHYAATIQLQREDFNGRVLTIRRNDLPLLTAVLGRHPKDLGVRLVGPPG